MLGLLPFYRAEESDRQMNSFTTGPDSISLQLALLPATAASLKSEIRERSLYLSLTYEILPSERTSVLYHENKNPPYLHLAVKV